ncbi:MAG: M48 family metalloprotease, partial [Calditrichaeota bacterium]|nr:M48 family metalloprotease [Calditrichota bacterium]
MNRKRSFRYFGLGFLAIILAITISCATNPVTGDREFMLVSEQQEISMGKEYDPQVVETYGVYDDADIAAYISDIGQRIATVSDRPGLAYEFKVLDSPVINAFAVPGGYVYFTRGILAYLNNEAEVVGVMGHEVGHIAARHSAKQISQQQIATIGLGVGSILSEDVAKYAGLAQAGLGLLFLRFGRDAERQSDQLGVDYSTKLGYDATEMANFFGTLDKMSGGESGGLPGWFSTHPAPDERVQNVTRMAQEQQAKNPAANYEVNREKYLRKIDGLIFGDDPRQGYAEEGFFYHPELKFQFPVPADWQVVNTPSQVQIANSDQNAVILFQLAQQNTARAAADNFVTQANAQKVSDDAMRVHSLNAVRLVSDVNSNDGVLRVVSYFIEYEGRVYLFHGLSNKLNFSRYGDTMENCMRGFNRLTNPLKINVEPNRIRIKTVAKTGTLEST